MQEAKEYRDNLMRIKWELVDLLEAAKNAYDSRLRNESIDAALKKVLEIR